MVDVTGVIVGTAVYGVIGLGLAFSVNIELKKSHAAGEKARPIADDLCFYPVTFIVIWFLWPLLILWFILDTLWLVMRPAGKPRTVCGIPLRRGRKTKKTNVRATDIERGDVMMQSSRGGVHILDRAGKVQEEASLGPVPIDAARVSRVPEDVAPPTEQMSTTSSPPPAYSG